MSAIETLECCPVCGGSSLARATTPGHWIGEAVFGPHAGALGLCRCRACGFVFVNPRPGAALRQTFYTGDDYVCHMPDHSQSADDKAAAQLAVVRRFVTPRPGARFLDYGCGGGYLLRHARDEGWDATGYDVGRSAILACRRQGLPVTDDLEMLARQRFDVIFLSHVFEHLADHEAVLARLAGMLTPSGRLCLEVPNARSLRAALSPPLLSRHLRFDERYRAFPIHLSYFSARTLPRLLVRHGFVVEGLTTYGIGLDELIVRPEPPRSAPAPTSAARRRRRRARRPRADQLARDLFKRVLFGLRLGENLFVAARTAGRPATAAQPARAAQ